MDVFEVRRQLIADYQEYTRSFVDIGDQRVRAHVAERIDGGYQWPEPWLSLNPNFAPGGQITELVANGLLDPQCANIFRLADGSPLHLRSVLKGSAFYEAMVYAYGRGAVIAASGAGANRGSRRPRIVTNASA